MQQGPGGALNVDIPSMAQAQANLIGSLPPSQQSFAINNLRAMSPELAEMVQQILAQQSGDQQQGGPQVDMRPLPEVKGPRRAAGPV
jgi:hypothetical protein